MRTTLVILDGTRGVVIYAHSETNTLDNVVLDQVVEKHNKEGDEEINRDNLEFVGIFEGHLNPIEDDGMEFIDLTNE